MEKVRKIEYDNSPQTASSDTFPTGKLESIIGCLHDNFAQLDGALTMMLNRIYQSQDVSGEELRANCRIASLADFSTEGEGWINSHFQGFHEKINGVKQVLF